MAMTPFKISRRRAVQTLVGCSTAWAAPLLWAQDSVAVNKDARLIVVFLRGAYDGLSAFVPYGDPHYASMRPSIAIAPPDGTTQTTVALDTTFGLHPAMANLLPLWKEGVLSVIPCAGNPDATRSHFDAQHHWETGTPGKSSGSVGWMNTLAGLRKDSKAIGVGEANPLILAGANPIQLVPKGNAATQQGALPRCRTKTVWRSRYFVPNVSRRCRQPHANRPNTHQRHQHHHGRPWHGQQRNGGRQ
jgi:uncharacterized protein (DUF1501 family)